GRQTTAWTSGWRGRSSAHVIMAVACRPMPAAPARRQRARARARPGPGAAPSSTRPTRATPSPRPAWSARPSRRRGTGVASRPSPRPAAGPAVDAVRRVCGTGHVTCRFTHVYPDGPAPYYTVIAPGRRGAELEQWATIKTAASDAILRHGGTITHHHAVGRDHRPWYDRE